VQLPGQLRLTVVAPDADTWDAYLAHADHLHHLRVARPALGPRRRRPRRLTINQTSRASERVSTVDFVPTFGDVVERSLALLTRRGRVSHTALRLEFDLDEATFAALREELVTVLGAAEDDGQVLIARNGASRPAPEPAVTHAEAVESAVAVDRADITVLLCDLADTPALEALGADARAVVSTRFHAICSEVAARQRGHVLPWVSDGVAIFFGHPRPQPDDALRAVRCGWEILRTLEGAREVIEREFGLPFSARLAIATGPAGGGADAAEAFGDTPRVAGAIQRRGATDCVTVDDATRLGAGEGFGFEPAYGAGDLFAVTVPRGGTTARHSATPLVGRTGERALLRALAERAADGTRSAVLVRGEAGIGKSRLVATLAAAVPGELGMTVLTCACDPYHRGSALYPMLAEMRSHGIALPSDGAALVPMSPERRRRESLAAVAGALYVAADEAPLLVVVEDLHWADPSTLELLAALLDGPRDVALMLALTARSEYAGPANPSLQRIELGRLDADESLRLVERVAAEGRLPDGVAGDLAQRAGGSPLLAEELTRTVLATQDARPTLATLYGCLTARLERDTTARAVAQLAATIGREFDVTLLHAVGTIERSALDWGLERLVQEDVIVEAGPGRYAFRHVLLQDAARSSQRKRALRSHNLQIARALLADFPHVAAAEPERIARHLEYAGELPESVHHWRAAGEQALAEHALSEAAGHFARAIELNARTPDGPPRRAAELELRVLAGRAIAARQGWGATGTVAHYARAERLSRDVEATPELFPALARLTAHRMISGQIDDALLLAQSLRDIASAARDTDLLLDAECAYGAALVHLGRHREALEHLAVAYELYDGDRHRPPAASGRANPAALALGYRAVAFACRSDAEGAHYDIAGAIELLRAHPHPYSQAWIHGAAATAAHIGGDRELTLREASAQLQLAVDEDLDDQRAHALALLGWARVAGGQLDGGLAQLREGIALWTAGGAVVQRPFLHGLLADALARTGDAYGALCALDDALSWVEQGERWYEPELHRMRAELLLERGDLAGAQRSAGLAVSLARRMVAGTWERRAAATFARAGHGSAVA
jgi:tetratricopeptide (TPR) repeat protein